MAKKKLIRKNTNCQWSIANRIGPVNSNFKSTTKQEEIDFITINVLWDSWMENHTFLSYRLFKKLSPINTSICSGPLVSQKNKYKVFHESPKCRRSNILKSHGIYYSVSITFNLLKIKFLPIGWTGKDFGRCTD